MSIVLCFLYAYIIMIISIIIIDDLFNRWVLPLKNSLCRQKGSERERERAQERETHLSVKFFLSIHLSWCNVSTHVDEYVKLQRFLIDTFNLVLHYMLSETTKIVFLLMIFIKRSKLLSPVIISVKKDIFLYTFVNTMTLVVVVLFVFDLLIQSFRRCSLYIHQ